jgi:ABC-2 type transport system ATP-binding protein
MILKFNNVSKTYKNNKFVLKKLSFCLEHNDFCALIGNNGCGKTTTINLLCNLIPINSGDIEIFENKLTSDYNSYKSKIGIVLSEHSFIEDLSIVDYLNFVCKFQKVNKTEIQKRIQDIIDLFELQSYSNLIIKELSTGNKMKVSLCAALIHNPEFLVLDEPFVNLDIQTTQKMIEVLKTLKNNKSLLITSHNLDLVTELCDRFLIMDDGKIFLEINKNNFNSIEELKLFIKSKLTKSFLNIKKIDWLN